MGCGLEELKLADRVWSASEVAAAYDADGDGMVNPWEIANGLDPNLNDANEDPDNDGYSNYSEYVAGTDPRDPESHP